MRVNSQRLDLRSLYVDQACTIITGSASITLEHGAHSIQMSMYFKGSGPIAFSTRFDSAQDERGKGIPTYWFHLDRLSPNRLYELTVTGQDDEGWPAYSFSDRTPGVEGEYARYRPDARTMIDRLLGRNR